MYRRKRTSAEVGNRDERIASKTVDALTKQSAVAEEAAGLESRVNARLVGLLMFLFGLPVFAVCLVWPVYQAYHGNHEVLITAKQFGKGVTLIVLGINLILFGKRAIQAFPGPDEPVRLSFFAVLLANVGLVVYAYEKMDSVLETLGIHNRAL